MGTIKNIIFDLGGIILNIDFKKTNAAFKALGVPDFDVHFSQWHADPLFKTLETGGVADDVFYDNFRKTTGLLVPNEAIAAAWNALLLDFPKERITLLQALKSKYRLFLFSNTNAIHHAAFTKSFQENFGFAFDDLFEHAFYSHLIGHRKPNIDAYHFVLQQAGIRGEETLFIDDTLPNVEAARAAGLHALHIIYPISICDILDKDGAMTVDL